MLSSAFRRAIGMQIRANFQYRFAFALSMIIFPFFLIVNVMLFESIYAYSGAEAIRGYSLTQMIWYFGALPFVWVFIYNNTANRLSQRILRGDLTTDFLRPMSIFNVELAATVGQRIVAMIIEFFPTLLIFMAIYYPSFLTVASFLKFVIVASFSMALMFLIGFLIGMAAFSIKTIRALDDLKSVALGLLGGGLIPLEFMPDSVRKVVDALPFKYVFYEPLQFFLNNPDKAGWKPLLATIGMQLLWICALFVIVRSIWSIAASRFCAAGG